MKLISHDIIRKPVITEKSMIVMAGSKHTFIVHMTANKIQVKEAAEEVFNVRVADVKTMGFEERTKRVGVHIRKRADLEKTVMTLVEDNSIEFFEGMQ